MRTHKAPMPTRRAMHTHTLARCISLNLAGLDPLARRRVHKMIEALKPGRIIVLTSHDLAESDA